LAGVVIGLWVYVGYFYFRPRTVKEPLPIPPAAVSENENKPSPVKLEQSDDWIRERAETLSSHSGLAAWLKTENIIRRITAAVNIIADGNSPKDSLGFLSPRKKFAVQKRGRNFYLDPQSYARYDWAADVFQSLNTEAAVKLFEELKPLFQDACRELGCWKRDFQDTWVRAVQELLRTPVVKGQIRLRKKVLSYAIMDTRLEELSAAQKHLLRMGPKNTAEIQGKLREIARTLGVPEDQLPKSQTYLSKVR